MEKFKNWMLAAAESFDAWRIVPRVMLIFYGYLVWSLYGWYKSIPVFTQQQCDGAVFKILLDQNIEFEIAKQLSCNIVGTVGGPSGEQTLFVTTIIGLAAAIFGLYTSTGRKWQKEEFQYQQRQEQWQNNQPYYPPYQYQPRYPTQYPYTPRYGERPPYNNSPWINKQNGEPVVDEETLEERRNKERWQEQSGEG